MKFIQVVDSAVRGGAEAHTRLLCAALRRAGHGVTLVHPPGDYARDFATLSASGVRVVPIDLRGRIGAAAERLAELIRSERPDVLHSHKHRADLACVLAARKSRGVRVISTVHNLLRFDVTNPFRRWAYYPPARWALSHMERVFTVCRFAADQTRRYFGLKEGRVVALVNGIDVAELDASARNEGALPFRKGSGETWIGCAGRLSHRKGQDVLLRAVAGLRKLRPDVRAVLLGDGPDRAALERLAGSPGLAGAVLFAGHVSPAAAIMARCDVYAQPSRWDPVPRALLEAMALGVPSVGSAVTGIPEILEEGRTGRLVKPDDAEGLRAVLDEMLSDRDRTRRLALAGASFVRSQCTMKRIAEDIVGALS